VRARISGSDIYLTTFLMTHHWCLTCSHVILYL
jgi:hypothetical protein